MRVMDITLDHPLDNLLLDDVILALAEQDGIRDGILRFWESDTTFIVLGRSGSASRDVRLSQAQATGVPVLRRRSGGGTVVQGKGCMNYALVLPRDLDPCLDNVRDSYRWISGKLILALRSCGMDADFHPISDLAETRTRRKFSGNAQRRTRHFILHHGTLLHQFDLSIIENLLAMPADMPPYRNQREHLDFVTNIPLDIREFKEALCKIFGGKEVEYRLPKRESDMLATLRREHDTIPALPPNP